MKNLILKTIKKKERKLEKSSSLPGLNTFDITIKEKKWDNRFNNKNENNNPFSERIFKNLRNKKTDKISKKIFSNSFSTYNIYNNNLNSTSSRFSLKRQSIKSNSLLSEKYIKNIENEKIIKLKKEVLIIWDDLCVLESYKELFEVISSQLDTNQKIEFYQCEIDSINFFKFELLELTKYIKERIDCISQLKTLNIQLSNILKTKSPESNEEILENISEEIQKLRRYTINIVNSFINFKKEFNHFSLEGKFNINRLEKRFCFDRNYLIKMKDELHFIKDGYIKFFFNIYNDNSPFLIKASEINNNNDSFIRKVPISDDEREEIKKCQFLIYQDLIFYQNRNYINGKIYRKISPIKNFSNNKNDVNKQSRLSTINYDTKKADESIVNKLNESSRNNRQMKSNTFTNFKKKNYNLLK